MPFTFQDLRDHVARERMLDTDFFAETVTYRIPKRDDVEIAVHCDHSVKEEFDEHGNELVIEQLKVKIHRDDIANAPDLQHAIRRAGDTRDYLYAFNGKHDAVLYHATFERRSRRSQAIR